MSKFEMYLINNEGYIKAVCYKFYNYYLKEYSKSVNYEDFYQTCCMNLYRDIDIKSLYDENKSSLSTYVFQKIQNYAGTMLRDLSAKKRGNDNSVVSLYQPLDCKSNNLTVEDNLSSYMYCEGVEDSINQGDKYLELIDKVINVIPKDKHKALFRMYLEGYTYKEIGQVLNMKDVNVSSMCQDIKKKFRNGVYVYE